MTSGRRARRERPGVVRRCRKLGRLLEAAKEVRLLEDRAGCVLGGSPKLLGVGDAVAVGHVHDLHPEPWRVGAYDLAHLRVDGLREDELGPACRVLRDVAGVRGDGRPVVAGRIRHVHPASSQITVWYSKIAWRTPWLISGWYGV